jgi:hypothetical protein
MLYQQLTDIYRKYSELWTAICCILAPIRFPETIQMLIPQLVRPAAKCNRRRFRIGRGKSRHERGPQPWGGRFQNLMRLVVTNREVLHVTTDPAFGKWPVGAIKSAQEWDSALGPIAIPSG